MNTSYRLVWSTTRQAYVVAHEHAKGRGKSAIRAALMIALANGLASPAAAALCGANTTIDSHVTGSTCQMDRSGDTLTVTSNGQLSVSNPNQAAVSIDSSSEALTGIQLDNAGVVQSTADTAVHINGTATNSIAVDSLINSGTISAADAAIKVSSNGAAVSIDQLINRAGATITSETVAILAAGSSDRSKLNMGGIDNYGTLSVTGDVNTFVIRLDSITAGQINNLGTDALIDGLGGGIGVYDSDIGGILNEGTIQVDNYAALLLDNSTVSGDIQNSGNLNADGGDGIHIYFSSITGDLINTAGATINSNGDYGRSVYLERSSVANIINGGEINSDTDDAINLNDSTAQSLTNQIGGLINGRSNGLTINDSDVDTITNHSFISSSAGPGWSASSGWGVYMHSDSWVTTLSNDGFIAGESGGIRVADESFLTTLDNSGILAGTTYALWVADDSQISNINIYGTTAQLAGDVYALYSDMTLKSASVFANENAYSLNSFTVENGATLNLGAGLHTAGGLSSDGITVANGFFNQGTVSLASSVTSSIHGDYTQSSSGALQIGVANNTTFGKLQVDGIATLASNAKIVVDVADPNYRFSVSQLANVLSAGTLVSDGSFAVTDNSLLFDFGAVKDGNTVDLTLRSNSATDPDVPSVEQVVRNQGNTPAGSAARVLDHTFAHNPAGELASHFVGLTDEQQVSDAVTQTLPLLTGGANGVTSNTLSGINRVIQARQESNSGLSSGDAPLTENNLWLKTFGSWADQDDRSGVSGFDADSKGLAIGADAAVSEQTRLGVAFAYAKTNVDSDSRIAPQDAQIDTFQVIGYGSYALAADTELNVQVDAGQNRNQGKRHMPFADATAKADYDSYSAHAGVGLGHTLRFGQDLAFVPSVRADYTWIGDQAYKEKGAGALNLDVDSRDVEELIFSADGKLNYSLGANTVLSANLGVGYDVINEQTAITSTYAGAAGAAFTTRGLDPSPWLARAGLGLSHTLSNGTELSLRYDAESRSDFLNQGASLKARWAF